jgi:hypothetical protein
MMTTKKTGLELLREPFPEHQISKLPKPTKAQTDEVKANYQTGIRCQICGGWHHPKVVHLDYVGHAALTDRLLDCDASWTWEPFALSDKNLPAIDGDGGLWIKLTVCGVTRLGYGDAQGKTGGDAMKERIGDALRNAAMRFGAALDLWHKGDLHLDDEEEKPKQSPAPNLIPPPLSQKEVDDCILAMNGCTDMEALKGIFGGAYKRGDELQKTILADIYNAKKILLETK